MKKNWEKIPEYSLYEASVNGEIKTFNWKNCGRERIMRPALDGCGYLRTMLKGDDGITKTIKVHRIIAQTFIPNPENKPCVNHLNSIRSDNRVPNLAWATYQENSKHSFTTTAHNNRGQNNSNATLTDNQVLEIRSKYTYGRKSKHDPGESKPKIAKRYNVSVSVIKKVVLGQTWKHLL